MKTDVPIVEIIWRDAFGEQEWTLMDEWNPKEMLICSVGHLLAEDENYYRLAANIVGDGTKKDYTMNIPKAIVVSMRTLRTKKCRK